MVNTSTTTIPDQRSKSFNIHWHYLTKHKEMVLFSGIQNERRE